MKKFKKTIMLLVALIALVECIQTYQPDDTGSDTNQNTTQVSKDLSPQVGEDLSDLKTTTTFCELSELDDLGRCGPAYGCFGPETIAEGERGAIGHIKPSGWHTVKYNDIIEGNYLYNRCHLIMWKVSGILDDERNLITGTRYMNTEGMLPYEMQVLDYIQDTGNHVMYRVTPDFRGTELVARGVYMEAS